MGKIIVKLSFLIFIILGIMSCPSPLEETDLRLLQDLNAPEITLNPALEGGAFESTLLVSGIIENKDENGQVRSESASSYIKSASYWINVENGDSGVIDLNDDGSFSFSIETAQYQGQITLWVETSDRNDNSSSASVTLDADTTGPDLRITSPGDYSEYASLIKLEGSLSDETTVICNLVKPETGGDISGVSLVPGNKQVTLYWDAVEGAKEYVIEEISYGTSVTFQNENGDLHLQYIWNSLKNGEQYCFKVTVK